MSSIICQGLVHTSCLPRRLSFSPSLSYHTFKAVATIYYFLINCLGCLLIADQCKALLSPPGLSTFPLEFSTQTQGTRSRGGNETQVFCMTMQSIITWGLTLTSFSLPAPFSTQEEDKKGIPNA